MKTPCRCTDVASSSPRCAPPPLRRHCSATLRLHGCRQTLHCIHPRINSVSAAAAVPAVESPGTLPTSSSRQLDKNFALSHDILGLGQAIVDWSSSVSDELLDQFDVPKGGRRVITVDERAAVMETLDELGAPSQVSAGGSLANTLVGVARLARAAGKDLRVALGGSLGVDTLGQFFNSQMRQAGVSCLLDSHHHHHHPSHHQHCNNQQAPHGSHSETTAMQEPSTTCAQHSQHSSQQQPPASSAPSSAHTGTVMVLTTPDAQRSFLSFFTSERLTLTERLRAAVRASQLVVVEGYLWEMCGAEEYVSAVLEAAHAVGAQVAMTAGDPGVVARHRDAMLRVVHRGVDMLFMNEAEAEALAGGLLAGSGEECTDVAAAAAATAAGHADSSPADSGDGARRAVLALAERCPIVVVTAGSKGSYVCAMGELCVVPPYWLPQGPVDTCGAGDAYAAGWLYAMMSGYDIRTAAGFASRVASAVIGRYGPHLSDDDAEELVRQLPGHQVPGARVRLGGMELGAGDFLDF
ncbi:hypothetical protein Agub_g1000 [Astrephomene gubernaculifera]|uniref:Carbohydrate kinase PfkB domain-containing protein n=1 Tax=Astrephomene gubernaculifera TaxID=47775 RepID=A0AAD3DI65_9CHLO|nr:hypothetical protein Agub_g1000 [Astrephomene gubernaculifera]